VYTGSTKKATQFPEWPSSLEQPRQQGDYRSQVQIAPEAKTKRLAARSTDFEKKKDTHEVLPILVLFPVRSTSDYFGVLSPFVHVRYFGVLGLQINYRIPDSKMWTRESFRLTQSESCVVDRVIVDEIDKAPIVL
jgi:hypothetical protein